MKTRSPRLASLRDHALPAAWGFAEATLFFIVPDVLLTWLALDRPRKGWIACATALFGALLGGAAMYGWGHADAEGARAVMDAIPGIRLEMIESVQWETVENGLLALPLAPLRGEPYKLYAVEWGAVAGSLPIFLLVSVPARLLRFLLVTALATALRLGPLARRSLRARRTIHVVSWLAFYIWYFSVMTG